jgi:hypothetical protein
VVATGGHRDIGLLAATGSGAFASVGGATDTAVVVGPAIEPTSDAGTYDEAYAIYRSLYPSLRSVFPGLASLDG